MRDAGPFDRRRDNPRCAYGTEEGVCTLHAGHNGEHRYPVPPSPARPLAPSLHRDMLLHVATVVAADEASANRTRVAWAHQSAQRDAERIRQATVAAIHGGLGLADAQMCAIRNEEFLSLEEEALYKSRSMAFDEALAEWRERVKR